MDIHFNISLHIALRSMQVSSCGAHSDADYVLSGGEFVWSMLKSIKSQTKKF